MLAFDAGSIMIAVVFVLIACSIIVILIRAICEWHHNNGQPKLAVEAKVVSKRMKLSTHQTGNGGDFREPGISDLTAYKMT